MVRKFSFGFFFFDLILFFNQLRFGYFASYNVPYFPEIYALSGFAEYAATHVTSSWQMAPRARLFRRDANSVETLDDLKSIMRFRFFCLCCVYGVLTVYLKVQQLSERQV